MYYDAFPPSFMDKALFATATTTIDAKPSVIWEALTTPEIIKKYFFGADVVTDWREGSSIIWKGEWNGKPFKDRGRIITVQEKLQLKMTHWSASSGKPHTPENENTLTFKLSEKDGKTEVTIVQDGNTSDKEREANEKNWTLLLKNLKTLLEKA